MSMVLNHLDVDNLDIDEWYPCNHLYNKVNKPDNRFQKNIEEEHMKLYMHHFQPFYLI